VANESWGQVEVVGLKEALREINNYDKKLRRRITREYVNIMQPVVDEATRLIPIRPPMSGWDRAWTPRGGDGEPVLPWGYRAGYSRRNLKPVKAFVSGKTPKTYNGYTRDLVAMGYRWVERRGVLFDLSEGGDTPQGKHMHKVLTQRYGRASRAMWKAYDIAGPDVQYELKELVGRVMQEASRVTQGRRF